MKSTIEIDHPGLGTIVGQSLESNGKVEYSIEEDPFRVEIEAEGIGPLRGSTDTVFRLASLALKLY